MTTGVVAFLFYKLRKWIIMASNDSVTGLSRRTFLKVSAIWAGGMWVVGSSVASGQTYRTLTEQDAEIMDHLADCIIPPGEYAGGKEAGVTNFIDQQISSEGHLQKDSVLYRVCLPAINKGSEKEYGSPFTELENDLQIAYLEKIESGAYDGEAKPAFWYGFTPSSFFETMRDHCMMGFYGSPKHGGNNNIVSFRMLGLY